MTNNDDLGEGVCLTSYCTNSYSLFLPQVGVGYSLALSR